MPASAAILSGAAPVSTEPAADALSYQVQAGAYVSQAEAEQQRAKLAIMGLESRIQEREVNGRTMFRVRLGPYAAKGCGRRGSHQTARCRGGICPGAHPEVSRGIALVDCRGLRA